MKTFQRLLLWFWTLVFLSLRPSIFGEKYNAIVFAIFFVISLVILAFDRHSLRLSRNVFFAVLLIYLCLIYFLVQGLLLSDARQIVINASVFLLLAVPCLALVLNRHQALVLKFFINIHYYLTISAVVTFLIFLFNGLSIYKLPILISLYDLVGYAVFDPIRPLSNHVLIFPYTVVWSTADIMGISFPRFVGLYREPGMAQIFFITAFILTYFVPVKHVRRKRFFLLTGCVLLFSAAGALNLILVLIIFTITNTSLKENLIALLRNPLFIFALIAAFIFLSRVAFQMTTQKIDNISGESRIESFKNGLTKLSEHPVFGKGYYSAFQKDKTGQIVLENNIGLIGVSFQIGIVGILLYVFCWAFSLSHLTTKRAIAIYIPCLATLLISQPSYNDAFVWFLLLLDTSSFRSREAGVELDTTDQ